MLRQFDEEGVIWRNLCSNWGPSDMDKLSFKKIWERYWFRCNGHAFIVCKFLAEIDEYIDAQNPLQTISQEVFALRENDLSIWWRTIWIIWRKLCTNCCPSDMDKLSF
jgi:hypothetical protein